MSEQDNDEREPLLSDEQISEDAARYAEECNSCYANDLNGYEVGGKTVRDWFMAKITSGELMVVRTCKNENMFMELQCSECGTTIDSDCPGACVWNQERYEANEPMVQFCPGCGSKITP